MRQQIHKSFTARCKCLLIIHILSRFSLTYTLSGQTSLSVAEVYRWGAESWFVHRGRITINTECAALCQQAELALDHKDIAQRAMRLRAYGDIGDDDGLTE